MIEKLRADLSRISVVAAIAGSVLLAFAFAWSRSARRLAAVEQRAAREQRLVALGSMSSVMAHELRNPLASLKGHAQLLVEDLTDDKQRTKASRVVAEAERLEVLTTNLLDFVRDGPIERTAITPADLVSQALEHLAKDRVDVTIEKAPKELRIDAVRLARAVHNLVDNALKASKDRRARRADALPKATARARNADREVRDHRDRDHGPPASPTTKMFEPFVTTRVKWHRARVRRSRDASPSSTMVRWWARTTLPVARVFDPAFSRASFGRSSFMKPAEKPVRTLVKGGPRARRRRRRGRAIVPRRVART